jgi:two-component sensor histidine kinase
MKGASHAVRPVYARRSREQVPRQSPTTEERTSSERHIGNVQQQGGIFVDAVRRTRMLNATARVHDLLSRSESAQRVDLANHVTDLCEALLMPITGNDDRIRFEARAEANILAETDTAFSLGIVLTELITNAVKYAFPAPRSGTILAQARRSQPSRIELLIQDDGIGVSHFREGSLGYGLVRSLVQRISGEIDIQSGEGLTVRITFADACQP